MSRMAHARDRIEVGIASALSLLFGASFGWNFGVDNQVVYMIYALRLASPRVLYKDWFATSTTQYHPAFKLLSAGLMLLDERGYAVGVMHTLVIGAGMTALYFLLRALAPRQHALPAFILLVVVASFTRTRGPNATYVFDWILQPSTLGSAAFLASLPFFVRGKWLASGLTLALSGLFHANYLILFFGAFTLAHLLLGRENLQERALKQLAPPFLVLLLFAPMIASTALAKDAQRAQEIYMFVRSPHHFVLAGHEREYLSLAGWTLVALGAAGPLARNPKSAAARLGALLCALSAVVWLGVGLSVVASLRQVAQLFAWRIVPHIELVLQALASAVVIRILLQPAASRRHAPMTLGLIIAGLGAVCLSSSFQGQGLMAAILVVTALLAAFARVSYELGGRFAPERARSLARHLWERGGAIAATLACAVLLWSPLGAELKQFRQRSNVFQGLRQPELELYAWMKANTPVDAMFLSPPEYENIRFHGRRAIVVDWKSAPVVPGEVLEWKRRMEDVIDRKLKGFDDLAGYATLDEARVERLRARYGVEYVIVQRGNEPALEHFKIVYANDLFVVLDVRG